MPPSKRSRVRCQGIFDDNSRCQRAATVGDFCDDCAEDIEEADREEAESAFQQFERDFKTRLSEHRLGEKLADRITEFAYGLIEPFIGAQGPRAAPPPRPGRQAHRHAPPPPPPPPPPPSRQELEQRARVVLGFGMKKPLTLKMIQERKREMARMHHPDRGGDVEVMQRVNEAAEILERLVSQA